MPRRPRIVVPGVPHHITQRGNDRQEVFLSARDRSIYLELLTASAARYGTRILGYCLMSNHVHLIAAPERENSLALTLGRAHSEYALALNRSERRTGHLWQNRFFSCPLDFTHLERALLYVELNPARARMIARPWDWPWSSARAHVLESAGDPALYGQWYDYFERWDYADWRERLLWAAPEGECDAVRRATRTGEPLGSDAFVTELERQAGRNLRVKQPGRPRTRTAARAA